MGVKSKLASAPKNKMAAASLNSTGSGLIKTDVYLISDQLKHICKNYFIYHPTFSHFCTMMQ
jgi:hypothetical protein